LGPSRIFKRITHEPSLEYLPSIKHKFKPKKNRPNGAVF
jgi:hypothetical protein